MVEIISIIVLSLLVIAQAVERYFFAKHMTDELSKCIKAVMSRNINEYITATTIDKVNNTEFVKNEEIEIENATDEEFDKAVGI